ncbi:hypothetical protein SAMN05216511_1602 [Streptomyces sp. KS_16]|nr:hypothetical protein BX261_5661 [Streptomyces sp. 2321.6]SDR09824.1 hypothetical protein SAMN05216511_1602 [Streptomyces sp. KS_16]SED74604.1 hypothetical protein SAMN05428940_5687 [Streptomyces sp. 2133.1]SNC72368.1 hypothetical protein SAMN06272741_5588 [Streptomyces sp. 2114.4]
MRKRNRKGKRMRTPGWPRGRTGARTPGWPRGRTGARMPGGTRARGRRGCGGRRRGVVAGPLPRPRPRAGDRPDVPRRPCGEQGAQQGVGVDRGDRQPCRTVRPRYDLCPTGQPWRSGRRALRLPGQRRSRCALRLDDHSGAGRGRLVPHRAALLMGQQPPVRDAVAGIGRARQPLRVMVDEDDGAAVRDPFGDRTVEHLPGALVQAGPGLVQDQEFGFGEQRLGDRDLLARPLGQLGQRGAGVRGRPEPGQPFGAAATGFGAGQTVDAAEVGEVVDGGEGQRGREPFGHIGAARAPGDTSGTGPVDPGQQPQQGGFPAAVGPLDAQQRTRGHLELYVPQHPRAPHPVAPPHPVQLHTCWHLHRHSALPPGAALGTATRCCSRHCCPALPPALPPGGLGPLRRPRR